MAYTIENLQRRPLYVYDLPQEILSTLQPKKSGFSTTPLSQSVDSAPAEDRDEVKIGQADTPQGPAATESQKAKISCNLCQATFKTTQEQRAHVKSDWHGYNLKQRLRNLKPVDEVDFERLVGELDESISGSDSSSASEEEDVTGRQGKDSTLSALLKKQARLHGSPDAGDEPSGEEGGGSLSKKRKGGAGNVPIMWFTSSLLPENTSLGVYKALFTNVEQEHPDPQDVLLQKQLRPVAMPKIQNGTNGVLIAPNNIGPTVFLCMIGGGHFAGMIVSLAPKIARKTGGVEERQAIVVAHKTFHRYTTRRKQGGSQSANDSAKGAAHSAGAGIRRHNEVALETEIRALLSDWRTMIDACQLLFVRATSTTNKRTLFGPYEGQVLQRNDGRNRSFPFNTRRATQGELMRAFVELTRMKISQVDEAALEAEAVAERAKQDDLKAKSVSAPVKSAPAKPSKEEETALLHTSQLQALIRRNKAPAITQYLSSNSVSPDFRFHPEDTQAHHHAPTPIHLAASTNASVVIHALLTRSNADPTVLNGEGRPAFDLAGNKSTRHAFRIARQELGEAKWDWEAAHVPEPLSRAEAEKREEEERSQESGAEKARREADIARIREAEEKNRKPLTGTKLGSRPSATAEMSAAEKREVETRGMSSDMKARVEREKRARAAEERMKRLTGAK